MSNSTSNLSDTIQRCPHDGENPYTQVLNALIRDNSISLNCRMLIIYLLSNKNTWTIRMSTLISDFKEHLGKDAVYSVINEAIEAGYIKRETYNQNNLKRYKYYLSEKPKFKKFLRYPESQDTGAQDPEKTDSKERTSKERTKKTTTASRVPASPVVVPFSKKVKETSKPEIPDKSKKYPSTSTEFPDSQEIEKLLTPFGLSQSMMKDFTKLKLNDVQQSVKAYEQLAKKQATKGALISAIRNKWKPNVTKEDIQKKKQDKQEEIKNLGEKNKKEIQGLIKKYRSCFTEEEHIRLGDGVAYIKFNGGFSPINLYDDNCMENIKNYFRDHLYIKEPL